MSSESSRSSPTSDVSSESSSSSSNNELERDDNQHLVDKIVDKRYNRRREIEYKVKWKGYSK